MPGFFICPTSTVSPTAQVRALLYFCIKTNPRAGHDLPAPTARVYAAAAQGIVAAGEEACRNTGDPFDAEVAELLRVALIVVRREAGEVVSEHTLQGVGAPLSVGCPWRDRWYRRRLH